MLRLKPAMRQMLLPLVSVPREPDTDRHAFRSPCTTSVGSGASIITFPSLTGRRALRCHQSPGDRRLTLISGSMRQVCEALDSLIDDND